MNKFMPEEDGLVMPIQNLRGQNIQKKHLPVAFRTKIARILLFLITSGTWLYGSIRMFFYLKPEMNRFGIILFFVLFSLNLLLISFAAASAAIGFIFSYIHKKWREASLSDSRTALIMPLYNEDVFRSLATLESMAEDLRKNFISSYFEIVILSDSTKSAAIEKEYQMFEILKKKISDYIPVWYRHRTDNEGRKAGNVADFIRRWGNRYDYMLVLDADSLMTAQTISTMVKRMQGDKKIGILQTVPVLYGHANCFARLQQFASRIYGRISAEGIAAWAGDDGNYWGHNAVIRVKAFADSCGLPHLKGRKPFGGAIMSHDFVEAALIRRAGWKVSISTDLDGSWDESPPSLLDVAARDRRWAQGNLQHIKVLQAKGLTVCNRLHFLMGITSYLSSPLWLAMLCTGLYVLFTDHITTVQILQNTNTLALCIYTMGILFLPKILGLCSSLTMSSLSKKCGGRIVLIIGAVLELLLSVLFAPIQMLFNTRSIIEIVCGQDSGWNSQRRNLLYVTWKESVGPVLYQSIAGFIIGCVLFIYDKNSLIWFIPVLAGFVLAIPLVKMSSSEKVGKLFAKMHLFLIPEETVNLDIIESRNCKEIELHNGFIAFIKKIASVQDKAVVCH